MATETVSYTFSGFKDEQLEATCIQWKKDADSGMAFPTDIEQLLAWVRNHVKPRELDSVAYGIFPKGELVADAIVEVVVTRATPKAPWVKMLRLRLKPSIDEGIYNKEIMAQAEAMQLFTAAVIGVVKVGGQHAAKTLKIFGRSNDQLSFLQGLAVELQKRDRFKVAIEGRWLVVKVVPKPE